MDFKKLLSLSVLICGVGLFYHPVTSHAIEYEQEWTHSWGGSLFDKYESVVETNDGGFVAVGFSYSADTDLEHKGSQDAIIVKINHNGEREWMKSWGGSGSDSFNSVLETSDGGFFVVGESSSTDAGFDNKGRSDALVAKYNKDGEQEWMKTWGGNGTDGFSSITKINDGGFVVIGYSRSTGMGFTYSGMDDPIIAKYNEEGEQEWLKKTWGGNGEDYNKSLIATSDGGFFVTGSSVSTNGGFVSNGTTTAILLKYDANGNQKWIKAWGGSGTDSFNSVVETSDGGFLIVGHSMSGDIGFINQGSFDAFIVKFDQSGRQEWIQSWGGSEWDQFMSVIETIDGGFFVFGDSASTDAGFEHKGDRDAIIVKYSKNGEQEWVHSVGSDGYEWTGQIIEALDGGVVIAGSVNVDATIIKLLPKKDSDILINGTVETMIADVTIPSVSPDLVINPNLPEGSISPEFNISNDSVSPIKLELKTFEQMTDTFNDVLPTKYESWVGLNKRQSQDIALGLIAKEGEGWQQLTTPTSYVANHQEHEIGIIKPTSSVDFSFDVKHGTSFSEAKTVQYKMVFVFDLIS